MVRSRKPGFTLVELLVVIAIIGILVALLLPAVQAAREAARRTQCTNNLKQLGLSVHNYHDAHKKIPPGMTEVNAAAPSGAWAWSVKILPFIEQTSLYDQLNPGVVKFGAAAKANLPLLQTPLAAFLCPSDVGSKTNENRKFPTLANPPTPNAAMAKSNYPGCNGNDNDTGFFTSISVDSANSPASISFGDVVDGLSNTFAIGERASIKSKEKIGTGAGNGQCQPAPQGCAGFAALWGGRSDETTTPGDIINKWGTVGVTCYRMQDGYSSTSVNFPTTAFSSMHPGGSQFAMGDGSVRLVSEQIAYETVLANPKLTYNLLGDRKDGQPVGDF